MGTRVRDQERSVAGYSSRLMGSIGDDDLGDVCSFHLGDGLNFGNLLIHWKESIYYKLFARLLTIMGVCQRLTDLFGTILKGKHPSPSLFFNHRLPSLTQCIVRRSSLYKGAFLDLP